MLSNEEMEENNSSPKAAVSAQMNKQATDYSQIEERPESTDLSCVSKATERSKTEPVDFSNFSSESQIQMKQDGPGSSQENRVSMQSKDEPIQFKEREPAGNKNQMDLETPEPPQPTCVSMFAGSTEQSKDESTEPKRRRPSLLEMLARLSTFSNQRSEAFRDPKEHLDSVCMVLEDDIISFVRTELQKMKNILSPEGSSCPKVDDETAGNEEQRSDNRDAFLKITLNFLKRRNEKQLADSLQNKTQAAICQVKLKSSLAKRCQYLFEGNSWRGKLTPVNQIYTELNVTEQETGEVDNEHEVQQTEAASLKPDDPETTISCEDIFKPGRDEQIRTLVTKGAAGIGKTLLTQKYTLDWAEGKTNRNIQFIFPFTFRELNLLKSQSITLVGLIHQFFPEIRKAGICSFEEFQIVFIFDGLDELQPPLDFHHTPVLIDVTEPSSVHTILVNLIRGKLLPSAHLWITTRPAAVHQIPIQYVDSEKEIRGFTDQRKKEYFRKRFQDKEHTNKIISHIETSRSLHTMCHIPVFCWITATVLDQVLKENKKTEMPKTLTELYIHFLVVQVSQDNEKYHKKVLTTDAIWNPETEKIFLAIGKLAFGQLEKRNLLFYEEDLKEYGIDINTASAYPGVFTETFKEESVLNRKRLFCFVHRSIQEFLAALYVFLVFMKTGDNLMRRSRSALQPESKFKQFYQSAVDKALESPDGYLDMFTRFLLGLSLKTNQDLLQGLLQKTKNAPQVQKTLVQHIKKNIRVCPSVEKSIRMFHWLNELNDHSLEEEIRLYLSGKVLEKELTSSQWSALIFVLLSSQKVLDVFDFKKFSKSKEALVWLAPVVKASKKSLLCSCNLSQRSSIHVVPVLTAENSCLRELDLSDNDLHDEGVDLLSFGLRSPKCRLKVLSLSGCLVTEKGCDYLASALTSNPSYLRELDLSFNHPGESGLDAFSAGLQDPNWKLKTLKADHCGKHRLNPSPQRFFLEQLLDPNTANRNLVLLPDNKHVKAVKEEQPYPDHPERFDTWKQVLCTDGLTGRCYWEVQWIGTVRIGLSYKGIRRKGEDDECCIGGNDQSWALSCSPQSFTAWHNNTPTEIKPLEKTNSNRLAVYLNWSAGTVSFYSLPGIVSSIKKIHLHTFETTFTEPLYAAFGFEQTQELQDESSSVSLIQVE
ncbi:NLR family CARD domain-containing protein 3-like isoform X2 [Xiphophorus couchianus]|uniref:NLR family CARD domain-containing protein 3-like isoform X2 n=1 Tax=Xiphophorus couchianus TaxID=32473 RepID=UPI001016C9C8|nr:NLR family CARD domain-containing protein 3-like isoform X2 [Xiphophorus couchianus]